MFVILLELAPVYTLLYLSCSVSVLAGQNSLTPMPTISSLFDVRNFSAVQFTWHQMPVLLSTTLLVL